MLEELYPAFLDMGYSPSLFWECSLAEIADLVESYSRREERRRKEQREGFKNRVVSLQVLALQIRDVFAATKENPDFRTVEQYYPGLFGEEGTSAPKEDKQLARRNERLRAWAAVHNARWRQEHGKEDN